jgi:hypothetical protein
MALEVVQVIHGFDSLMPWCGLSRAYRSVQLGEAYGRMPRGMLDTPDRPPSAKASSLIIIIQFCVTSVSSQVQPLDVKPCIVCNDGSSY